MFGAVFRVLGLAFAFFIDSLPSRTDSYWALVFTALAPLIPIAANIARPRTSGLGKAVSVITNSVSGETDVRMRELVIDRSGLTIQRTLVRNHLPWRDIAQIGMLRPERGALNHRLPVDQHTRTDVLVVRLRPEVPAVRVLSVLSDEHQQLGYLGLCTVEELQSSRQEMTSALEQFAGGKLVHNSRQFLDRDPRLRPEMV